MGSGAHGSIQFWKPIPKTGYTCPGTVGVGNYHDPPPLDAVVCYQNRFGISFPSAWVWDDKKSGSRLDGSCWDINWPLTHIGLETADCHIGYHGPHINSVAQHYLIEFNEGQVL